MGEAWIKECWPSILPQIVQGLTELANKSGRDSYGEEPWAKGKSFTGQGLEVEIDGDFETGPFRIVVYENVLGESEIAEFDAPVLSLEIRPRVLWVREALQLIQAEKAKPLVSTA